MADEIYGLLLTNIGRKKINQAIAEGKQVDLTKLVLGDSNGSYYLPTVEQTELVNALDSCDITSFGFDPTDETRLLIKGYIESRVGGFTLREIGVVDSEGDLIAVSSCGAIELISYRSGEILGLNLNLYLQLKQGDLESINITVTPTSEDKLKEEVLEEVKIMLKDINYNLYSATDTDIDNIFRTAGGVLPDIPNISEDGNHFVADDNDIDGIFGNIVDLPELPPITSGGNCDCEHEHEHEMADFDDIDSLFG